MAYATPLCLPALSARVQQRCSPSTRVLDCANGRTKDKAIVLGWCSQRLSPYQVGLVFHCVWSHRIGFHFLYSTHLCYLLCSCSSRGWVKETQPSQGAGLPRYQEPVNICHHLPCRLKYNHHPSLYMPLFCLSSYIQSNKQ